MTQTEVRGWRAFAAALARWWWLALALWALVVAGAFLRAYGPGVPRVYNASVAAYLVALPPPGQLSAYDAGLLRQQEEATARELAGGDLLRSEAFGTAVAARADRDAGSALHLDIRGLAAALAAAHDGNLLRITARWSSPQAGAIARAAVEVLAEQLQAGGASGAGAGIPSVSYRVEAVGPDSVATLDPAAETVRRIELAERVAAGLALGLAAALLAAWLERRGGRFALAGKPAHHGTGNPPGA